MSGYRIAKSLAVLRAELDQRWPARDKASDGWIGDAAHAATASDHNPNPEGVVCAFDVTHDPVGGPDCAGLFDLFRAAPPPAAKYVIFDHRIASRAYGWAPRPYTGADPHTSHLHVSVGVGPDGQSTGPYDDETPWPVALPGPTPVEVTEMTLIRRASDGTICVLAGDKWFALSDPVDAAAFAGAMVKQVDVSDPTFDRMVETFGQPVGL